MALFNGLGSALPSELAPYREMLNVLGLERTGQKPEALERARNLWERAPEDLRYYVAYALARLETDPVARHESFVRMADSALEKAQLRSALRELVALPGATVEEALRLVEIESRNDRALKILADSPDPRPDGGLFALGYAAYLRGRHEKAIDWLSQVPEGGKKSDRARFYHGYSLYRLKRDNEALEIWRPLALREGSYAKSALRRISITASRSRQRALAILEEASKGKTPVAATALFRLANLVGGERGQTLRDRLVAQHPTSPEAIEILWERGWDLWKESRPEEALALWQKGLDGAKEERSRARLLYWTARCHEEARRDEAVRPRHDELARLHPLSVYTLEALPDGGRPLSDDLPPGLASEPDDLERWGFVHYARLRHLRLGDERGQLRAALLASWLGDDRTAYLLAAGLQRFLAGEGPLSRPLLELLHPRPYAEQVRKAAAAYDVDPNLIWSVMRQESAFDPEATSWVGAMGLMQLMPATAKEEARLLKVESDRFYDVNVNITLGAGHLARLLRRHKRLDWAIAAYNGGSGNVNRWLKGNEEAPTERWIEEIGFDETSDYARRVLANLAFYRRLYADL